MTIDVITDFVYLSNFYDLPHPVACERTSITFDFLPPLSVDEQFRGWALKIKYSLQLSFSVCLQP